MKMINQETCRSNPWSELDRLFGQAFAYEQDHRTRAIPVAFYRTEEAQVLELELPGVEKKQINLSFEKGILTVEATRKLRRPDADKELSYKQSIRIGNEFDFKKTDAKLENGVLSITLPRREQDKPYRISVS